MPEKLSFEGLKKDNYNEAEDPFKPHRGDFEKIMEILQRKKREFAGKTGSKDRLQLVLLYKLAWHHCPIPTRPNYWLAEDPRYCGLFFDLLELLGQATPEMENAEKEKTFWFMEKLKIARNQAKRYEMHAYWLIKRDLYSDAIGALNLGIARNAKPREGLESLIYGIQSINQDPIQCTPRPSLVNEKHRSVTVGAEARRGVESHQRNENESHRRTNRMSPKKSEPKRRHGITNNHDRNLESRGRKESAMKKMSTSGMGWNGPNGMDRYADLRIDTHYTEGKEEESSSSSSNHSSTNNRKEEERGKDKARDPRGHERSRDKRANPVASSNNLKHRAQSANVRRTDYRDDHDIVLVGSPRIAQERNGNSVLEDPQLQIEKFNVRLSACISDTEEPTRISGQPKKTSQPSRRADRGEDLVKKWDSSGRVQHYHTMNGTVYERIKVVGKGGSCRVYKVKHTGTGDIYALKRVMAETSDSFQRFKIEVKLLNALRGKSHIIQMYDYEINEKFLRINMLLEYGQCDLSAYLTPSPESTKRNDKHTSSIAQVRKTWQAMLSAVNEVHEARIVHMDLKPQNFLIVNGEVKLIDFGIANDIPDSTTNCIPLQTLGTLSYMAPEAQKVGQLGTTKMSRSADIWSLGIILYMILFHTKPYRSLTPLQRFITLSNPCNQIEIPPIKEDMLPGSTEYDRENAQDVIRRCLVHDPSKRAKIPDLLRHEFLRPEVQVSKNTIKEVVMPYLKNFTRPPNDILDGPERVKADEVREMAPCSDKGRCDPDLSSSAQAHDNPRRGIGTELRHEDINVHKNDPEYPTSSRQEWAGNVQDKKRTGEGKVNGNNNSNSNNNSNKNSNNNSSNNSNSTNDGNNNNKKSNNSSNNNKKSNNSSINNSNNKNNNHHRSPNNSNNNYVPVRSPQRDNPPSRERTMAEKIRDMDNNNNSDNSNNNSSKTPRECEEESEQGIISDHDDESFETAEQQFSESHLIGRPNRGTGDKNTKKNKDEKKDVVMMDPVHSEYSTSAPVHDSGYSTNTPVPHQQYSSSSSHHHPVTHLDPRKKKALKRNESNNAGIIKIDGEDEDVSMDGQDDTSLNRAAEDSRSLLKESWAGKGASTELASPLCALGTNSGVNSGSSPSAEAPTPRLNINAPSPPQDIAYSSNPSPNPNSSESLREPNNSQKKSKTNERDRLLGHSPHDGTASNSHKSSPLGWRHNKSYNNDEKITDASQNHGCKNVGKYVCNNSSNATNVGNSRSYPGKAEMKPSPQSSFTRSSYQVKHQSNNNREPLATIFTNQKHSRGGMMEGVKKREPPSTGPKKSPTTTSTKAVPSTKGMTEFERLRSKILGPKAEDYDGKPIV